MTRQEASARGLGRYHGRLCRKHKELAGERLTANTYCYGCHLDKRKARRAADPERYRARQRQRHSTDEYREQRKERDSRPPVRAARHARIVRRRWGTLEDVATDRAFARLSRKAKRLGLVIDHVTPLAPCRVCGERGTHTLDNWQLLTNAQNSSKGNRCMSCWRDKSSDFVVRNELRD